MTITVPDVPQSDKTTVLKQVLATTLSSVAAGSRVAYSHNLQEFLTWWMTSGQGNPYAAVQAYLQYLQEDRNLSFVFIYGPMDHWFI